MAQRVHVVLEDDLDGSSAEETVSFSLDGTAYEIDLNAKNADRLREAMAEYVGHARRAGSGSGGSGSRSRSGSSSRRTAATVDREQIKAIRDWARRNGHKVSDRGRIAAPVVEAYHQANG
ncbi:MAG: Lsr2 family protein [bacterium]